MIRRCRRGVHFDLSGQVLLDGRPIIAQLLAVLLVRIMIFEFLTGRAAINILV